MLIKNKNEQNKGQKQVTGGVLIKGCRLKTDNVSRKGSSLWNAQNCSQNSEKGNIFLTQKKIRILICIILSAIKFFIK